jgi:hypothetical protein
MHYDMFTLNTTDVREFCQIADGRGLHYRILKTAQKVILNKETLP